MKSALFVSCVVLMVVPGLFIYHKVYRDGIVGRIGLGGIIVFSFVTLSEMFDGRVPADPPPSLVLLAASFAVFLCWHLWRFHRRVLKPHQTVVQEQRSGADRRFLLNGNE